MRLIIQHCCIVVFILGIATGCTESRPTSTENICAIFKHYPHWYWETQAAAMKWDIPMPVLMAIVKQESDFQAEAKPPRKKVLHLIPWRRPTSAFGFSQVIDSTWEEYETRIAGGKANRNLFADAIDFAGWYCHQARVKFHIKKNDAFRLYLAYHEGFTGYARKTYLHKHQLLRTAHRVSKQASIYKKQLRKCIGKLKKNIRWRLQALLGLL